MLAVKRKVIEAVLVIVFFPSGDNGIQLSGACFNQTESSDYPDRFFWIHAGKEGRHVCRGGEWISA